MQDYQINQRIKLIEPMKSKVRSYKIKGFAWTNGPFWKPWPSHVHTSWYLLKYHIVDGTTKILHSFSSNEIVSSFENALMNIPFMLMTECPLKFDWHCFYIQNNWLSDNFYMSMLILLDNSSVSIIILYWNLFFIH